MRQRLLIILLALLVDHILGDPPNAWHPVAWMGQGIAWGQRHAPGEASSPLRQMLFGASLILVGMSLMWGIGRGLARIARLLAGPGLLLEALILKTTLARRGLLQAARQVETALAQNDLPAARHWLSWHLVSRDTSQLTAAQIAAATIESVAENLSDGLIAPLTWYLLGGLPAALTYRFLNTADAMLGYRDPTREWLGKIPARMDDLANLLPARLTALLILLAAPLAQGDIRRGWRIWRRDARLTASPNAGHPMSAMAGVLGLRLEKPGHYILGPDLPQPTHEDIARARRILLDFHPIP